MIFLLMGFLRGWSLGRPRTCDDAPVDRSDERYNRCH